MRHVITALCYLYPAAVMLAVAIVVTQLAS
jgi:hypothetical protein